MFTIKFYRDVFAEASTKDSVKVEAGLLTAISCPHYDALSRRDGSHTITTYKNQLSDSGVERHIREGDYDVCFVENEAGKTIERFRLNAHELNDPR